MHHSAPVLRAKEQIIEITWNCRTEELNYVHRQVNIARASNILGSSLSLIQVMTEGSFHNCLMRAMSPSARYRRYSCSHPKMTSELLISHSLPTVSVLQFWFMCFKHWNLWKLHIRFRGLKIRKVYILGVFFRNQITLRDNAWCLIVSKDNIKTVVMKVCFEVLNWIRSTEDLFVDKIISPTLR